MSVVKQYLSRGVQGNFDRLLFPTFWGGGGGDIQGPPLNETLMTPPIMNIVIVERYLAQALSTKI